MLSTAQHSHCPPQGQDMVVRHFVPPSSSSREAVLALAAANRRRWRVMRQELACSGAQQSDGQRPQSSEAEERGDFPMGYRGHTHQRDGWVDLACGPSISLAIEYVSRAHHPNPALPNSLRVDVQAPTVLLRVFGFLATDLLALKVSPHSSRHSVQDVQDASLCCCFHSPDHPTGELPGRVHRVFLLPLHFPFRKCVHFCPPAPSGRGAAPFSPLRGSGCTTGEVSGCSGRLYSPQHLRRVPHCTSHSPRCT